MDQITLLQDDLNPENLRSKIPQSPGIYQFKDPSGRIIYIGKAKNLRKRVLSYFKPRSDLPRKTALMMSRAVGLDFILTSTEKEAFILESSLIKKNMPRYNIVLRDDKQYPCLRLDIQDDYPRLTIVRRIKKDGALYFGPFSSAQSVRSTLKLINRLFQLRKCRSRDLPKRSRPCLNHQLERCLGPCSRDVSKTGYREVVEQVRMFLEGRSLELIGQLKKNMASAAESLDFEKAARIRDQIRAVERVIERQSVVSTRLEDQDVIGLAQDHGVTMLVILFIRKGYLTGSRHYVFKGGEEAPSEVVEAFLKQYYSREHFIPKQILISQGIEDLHPITEWISDLSGKKVAIHHPRRGRNARLILMAVANAENLLSSRAGAGQEDLTALAQSVLGLKRAPRIIEGLDISNLQGEMAVGAVVSFEEGLPRKEGYRNYRIKNRSGIDDYGMMAEMVSRRLARGNLPELFLVDGGKGHLQAVRKVVDQFEGEEKPDIVAIAKSDGKGQGDRIFIPGRKNPLPLRGGHPLLLLLMRIRDEAHRRAVTYHRRLRKGGLKKSDLDRVPGIGPGRKRALLKHFGGIEAVSGAGIEDLLQVPGINRFLAQNIIQFFKNSLDGMG
ncbi:MAG: excinuclease ABC subunit UvrC [Pseudomonadota bacterium]